MPWSARARGCKQPCMCVWCSVLSGCYEYLFMHSGGVVTGVIFAGVHEASLVLVAGVGCEAVGLYMSRSFGTCVYGLKFYVGSEVSLQCQGFRLNYVR